MNDDELREYGKNYDKNIAWQFLKGLRKKTKGVFLADGVIGSLVWGLGNLLSSLENPETPAQLKARIVGAIGYTILPIDAIPDFIPVVGFTDDLAIVTTLLATVMMYSSFSMEDLDAAIEKEERRKKSSPLPSFDYLLPSNNKGERYVLESKGIWAVGLKKGDEITVLRYSQAVLEVVESFRTHNYYPLRERLIDDGTLVKKDNYYEFNEDYSFSSFSAAEAVILGRAGHGKKSWRQMD